MLSRVSALASAKPFTGSGLNIFEASDFLLTQYAGSEKNLKKALGKIPARVGIEQDGLMRISPTQIIVIDVEISNSRQVANDGLEGVYITPLSSSRTRIALEGENARAVMAKVAAIDFHPKLFKSGMFVQTGIHHTPVLIHCTAENSFHVYAMRTFAMSVWETVIDAALEFSA